MNWKSFAESSVDYIDDILDHFDIKLNQNNKKYWGSCPIHQSDNPNSFHLYTSGNTTRGNYVCYTQGCQEVFGPSFIGFCRGLLSRFKLGWQTQGDAVYSLGRTVKFIKGFASSRPPKPINYNWIRQEENHHHQYSLDISQINNLLSCPAQYYIDRGYSAEILKKYYVGLCTNTSKMMYNRVVFPVIEQSHMVGCTGRSIYPKCTVCKGYHQGRCPEKSYLWKFSKWKHSIGFKTKYHLYNWDNAQEEIKTSQTVILTESPGDTLRLVEAGIKNCVGIFGDNLSSEQRSLIDTSGALTIVLALNNDKAGIEGAHRIIQQCKKLYRIYQLDLQKNDIGEMTVTEVNQGIAPQLQSLRDKGVY